MRSSIQISRRGRFCLPFGCLCSDFSLKVSAWPSGVKQGLLCWTAVGEFKRKNIVVALGVAVKFKPVGDVVLRRRQGAVPFHFPMPCAA
jgi:hypothetical protein